MKVLYLFAGKRRKVFEEYKKGETPDNLLLGLNHLASLGIEADFLENRWTEFFRKISFNFTQIPAIATSLKYDIVFSGSGLLALFFVKRVLRRKKPYWYLYNTYFSNLLRRNRKGIKAYIIRSALKAADGIISTSRAQNDALLTAGVSKEKLHFIPEGVDKIFFSKTTEVKELKVPSAYVMSAGRDIGRDYSTLLAAIEKTELPLVIGALPRNFPERTWFPKNVTVSYFPPDSYREAIRRSAFMVITTVAKDYARGSDSTGLYVLLESMILGKAVIITERAEFKDYFIPGENGLMVKAGDSDALRNAIEYLWANPHEARRMGERNRQFVLAHATTEHFAKAIAHLWQERL